MIETKINGITNIFNKSINPLANSPYHLLISAMNGTSSGASGNPPTT